jgi:hypothetical protein
VLYLGQPRRGYPSQKGGADGENQAANLVVHFKEE